MSETYAWGHDLVSPQFDNQALALESFNQGPVASAPHPFFKPFNIKAEGGFYFANLYICQAASGTIGAQQLAIWLSSLKDTDHVHLTISSLILDIPYMAMLDVLSSVVSTRAKIEIHLDSIVSDSLAYFYLAAAVVTRGHRGALYVPSYLAQRVEDASGPWRAMYDFYKWIVDAACERGLLTTDEADCLHAGRAVIIPNDRFAGLA